MSHNDYNTLLDALTPRLIIKILQIENNMDFKHNRPYAHIQIDDKCTDCNRIVSLQESAADSSTSNTIDVPTLKLDNKLNYNRSKYNFPYIVLIHNDQSKHMGSMFNVLKNLDLRLSVLLCDHQK